MHLYTHTHTHTHIYIYIYIMQNCRINLVSFASDSFLHNMQFMQMKRKLSIHGALCSSLGGMWKGLHDNVLNRAKSSCSIVPVGGIVGNVGLNKVALSPCHLAVPSLRSSAQWGWLSGRERGCNVVASGLCTCVKVLESMWKCVWEDTSEKTQCHSACVNVCAVILQCARGKVLLELGRLKAASWISSRCTSLGSQVCSPCPTHHWAFPVHPEGPACWTLTQSLVHVSGRANQRCTAVGICVCYSSILPEKAKGVCGYTSACAHLSLTETYACAMAWVCCVYVWNSTFSELFLL